MRRTFLPVLAALLLASPAGAQEKSLRIRSFDAELLVRPEGRVEVTEALRFAFTGQWNGVLRDLSLQHETGDGIREKLRIEVVSVTDGAGEPYEYDEESGDDSWTKRLRIWVPNARDAEHTVVIRYRVANALRFFYGGNVGELDELYWNATGNNWEIPIDRATARIVLPEGVVPKQSAVYTGYAGSQADEADIVTRGNVVTFTTRRELAPGEGMTVATGWPPGAILNRPSAAAHRRALAFRLWPLGLPLLAFFLSFRAWRRRGRDPEKQAVVVQYRPPDDMSPAELGTLVDHRAEMRDITATLVDLAVRGYVGIEEREERKLLGLIKDTEFVFHLRRPRESWSELAAHERRFIDGLFTGATTAASPWEVIRAAVAEGRRAREAGEEVDRHAVVSSVMGGEPREEVRLDELKHRFYRYLPGIRDSIYESLVRRGHYLNRPDKVKDNWLILAIVTAIGSGLAAGFAGDHAGAWVSMEALLVGGLSSAAVIFLFGRVMPARTVAGARAREAALGFREFLERVESERYRQMVTSPEMFERYLPHAMAFGVEERWARPFEGLYREPPDWYSGGGYDGFRASHFASRMHSLSSSAGSTMSSSPSSSGSGGGGSSGGGSGGGGGGGF